MNQSDIIEKNKLLAYYDGWRVRKEPFVNSGGESFIWWEKFEDGALIKTYHHHILIAKGSGEWGSYHNSWYWLMPLIHKLFDGDSSPGQQYDKRCQKGDKITDMIRHSVIYEDIEQCWAYVAELVEWWYVDKKVYKILEKSKVI